MNTEYCKPIGYKWEKVHEIHTPITELLDDNDYICQVVSNYFRVPVGDIKLKTRKREIVQARGVSMTIMRIKGMTLKSIGAYFNSDHTTVMHNLRAIQDFVDTNKGFKEKVERIKTELV